jgi:hypothetical protein
MKAQNWMDLIREQVEQSRNRIRLPDDVKKHKTELLKYLVLLQKAYEIMKKLRTVQVKNLYSQLALRFLDFRFQYFQKHVSGFEHRTRYLAFDETKATRGYVLSTDHKLNHGYVVLVHAKKNETSDAHVLPSPDATRGRLEEG